MSTWLERPERKQKNPAKKFLEWKSDDGCFSYYDKEKEDDVKVPLPLKFVILEHYHTVKGWHDESKSGIFSNEVFSIGSEKMNVRAFKGGAIANGYYKDIKQVVKQKGGHYSRSIYAVTNDLEIINISLKGSAVSSYSDFINDFGDHNFDKNWIEVTEAEERKKGKIEFSVPVFKVGQKITKREKLEPFANELQSYILEYMKRDEPNRERSEIDKYEEETTGNEEVPF